MTAFTQGPVRFPDIVSRVPPIYKPYGPVRYILAPVDKSMAHRILMYGISKRNSITNSTAKSLAKVGVGALIVKFMYDIHVSSMYKRLDYRSVDLYPHDRRYLTW